MKLFKGIFASREVRLLYEVLANTERIMANTQETLARLQAATASLNGIRADIQALKDLVAAGGTPQEVADAVNSLAESMGALDAENPAP